MEVLIVKRFSSIPLILSALFVAAAGVGSILPAHAASFTMAAAGQDNGQDSNSSSVNGNWQISFTDMQGNPRQGSLEIHQDGSKLSGAFQGQRGSGALSGSLQGNQVSMTVKAHGRELTFSGTVDGNKMSGTTNQGSSWSASRQ
jgi:hypothetical protein